MCIYSCKVVVNGFGLMGHGRDFEPCNQIGVTAFYLKKLLNSHELYCYF